MNDRERQRVEPEIAALKAVAADLNERASRLASKGLRVELEASKTLNSAAPVVVARVFEELK
jgi:3-methyladenine DNA glycosylase AlkC